jgi:hypothetical protein
MTFPWVASYGDALKIANNSGNTYAPLVLRALRKREKELAKKKSLTRKNKKKPLKNVCPQIGNIGEFK